MSRSFLLLLAGLVILITVPARAQTVELNERQIKRENELRPTSEQPLAINYADCINDDILYFPITVSGTVSKHFVEIWVGTGSLNCTERDNRELDSVENDCWRVRQWNVDDDQVTLDVHVRDVVERVEYLTGTAQGCDDRPDETAITFYFLLINSSDVEAHDKWSTTLDVVGQSPPAEIKVSPANERLIVSWEGGNNDEIVGYRVFCGTPGDTPPQTLADGGMLATATPTSGCSSSNLVAGQRPSSDMEPCGSTGRGQSSTATEPLGNEGEVAIAVATVDEVGNYGPLSTVLCATPVPIDDFFDAYVQAGGQGGGGFCAMSLGSPANLGGLGVGLLGLLGLTARRIRRRKGRRVRP